MAEELLLKLTLLPSNEIQKILSEHSGDPGGRLAQKALASAVTSIVHGNEAATRAERVSLLLFSEAPPQQADWAIIAESAPSHAIQSGSSILDALVSSGLASSKREAREFIEGRAVNLNGLPVEADRV